MKNLHVFSIAALVVLAGNTEMNARAMTTLKNGVKELGSEINDGAKKIKDKLTPCHLKNDACKAADQAKVAARDAERHAKDAARETKAQAKNIARS